jgi:hypothetical protein
MVLKLIIEPGQGYHVTDGQAARWVAADAVRREAAAPAGFVPKRNVVAGYLADGVLRPEQVRAAEEIAFHWHAVTRALHARCALYAERMPRGEDRDNPAEAPRTARYLRWAGWAGASAVTPAASLVDLTLDLAVDGLTWRGIRAKRGVAQQRAKLVVQRSLWGYALLSGWVEERNAA